MKTRSLLSLVILMLFVGSAYAGDPAQQATLVNGFPQITFDAGPIVMNRVQSNRTILSSPGNQGSGDVMKSSMIDDDWRVGGQARLRLGFPNFYLDFGGFMIPTGTTTVNKPVPSGSNTVETSPPTRYGGPTLGDASFKYLSSITNIEMNIGHNYTSWLSTYAGVRYIRLKEEFDFLAPFPGGFIEDDNWKAKNSMIGVQIGARADIFKIVGVPAASPWSLDTNLALALLHNDTSANFATTSNLFSSLSGSSTKEFWTPGVAVEADLGYRLSSHVKLAAGYQMLYLGSVALAPNQVRGTGNYNPGPSSVISSSVEKASVIYHGAVAKLIINF
jgi:hypothetical protein